ncbi:MAG: peptidoglycan-binding domain-containing protein [Alphaproteobacteria bacterium]
MPPPLPRRRPAIPAIVAGILCLGIAGTAAADQKFSRIATEILDGIEDSRAGLVPATSGYGAPTIAIRAFAKNGPPVPIEVANAWNRRLLAELHRQSRGRFEFVDMASIGDLVRTIRESNGAEQDKSRRIADLKSNIRADILVTGDITLAGTTPVLAYQAFGIANGRLLASTTPQRIVWPEPVSTQPVRVASAEPPPLQAVATGRYRPIVEETERRLADLGYDPGPVDGILTWETREALRAYQADSALPVNGRMTRRTVVNMRRDTR